MAIRKNRITRKLSNEDVLKMRDEFFYGRTTIDNIAYSFGVSISTAKDAIHGKRYYENIPDEIPQHDKDNRIQWRTFVSTKKSRRARDIRQSKKILADFHKWQRDEIERKWEEKKND